jgi:kynurenine formamidase
MFNDLRQWGSGQTVDESGAVTNVTPEIARRALSTARTGQSVSLARPIGRMSEHIRMGGADKNAISEPSGHKDVISLDYHTTAVSHIDAVCHIGYGGELYGGVDLDQAFSPELGSNWGAVTAMQSGVVTRGVLIDMPVLRDCTWLAPSTSVHADDILHAERQLGFVIGPGDAVLLRSGHGARRLALGPEAQDVASSGYHLDAMPLLASRKISLLGADEENDARPSPVTGVPSPIHVLAITALGIPLMDNLDLEALSQACAAAGRYDFLLVVAPLVMLGGTGSPLNPIAVF